MNLRHNQLELAAKHELSPQQTQLLLDEAQLGAEPGGLDAKLPRVVAALAAGLGGLGVVMWIAANWEQIGRFSQFALLQGVVLIAGLGATLRQRTRAPLALLALLGIGALFAYFGQTYQTGADPWQLFALWAALSLPLCWGTRSDLLWVPWVLITATAIALWIHTYSGYRWHVAPALLRTHLTGWSVSLLMVGLVCPQGHRVTGAGMWSFRLATALAISAITTTALSGLFDGEALPAFHFGLLLLAACAVWLSTRKGFDVFALSTTALGLITLVVCGLANTLGASLWHDDWFGGLLLITVTATALLAGSVTGILKISRRYNTVPEVEGEAA